MKLNLSTMLYLSNKEANSPLKIEVYKEALNEINSKFPLYEDEVDLRQIYIIKNNDILETEFFIRNGFNKNISPEEDFVLFVKDRYKNIVASKKLNLKDYGIIPPFSSCPFNVKLEIDENVNLIESKEYYIDVDNIDKLKIFSLDIIEVEGIPIEVTFDEEKNIRDFISRLPALKEGEFKKDIYKINYTNSGSIICTLLVRNGTEKEFDLGELVISIVNEGRVSIAQKLKSRNDTKIKIESMKAKLLNIEFNSNEVFEYRCDLSKCRVVFSK
jgi:SLAP domain-containing protein